MYAISTAPSNSTKHRQRNADPFALLARDFFGFDPFTARAKTSVRTNSPQFDLVEDPEHYILRADLPGISEDALEITVHEGVLTVSGTREEESLEEGEEYLVRERRSGSFSRQLKLAKNADPSQIEAKLNDGVLVVSIAKKPEAKARKIAIG
ncbi:MAG: Hsp20/alpha crystallin family protein [Kofleriaceae bacterium]|nr:Hsp20/alpha crystallin family protein [Kofleriaceae bacterium]